jgi:hypothetical protein
MSNVIEFYKQDFPSTLFPLNTNLILIENHSEEINKYVYERILNPAMNEHSFYHNKKYMQRSLKIT